MTLSQVTALLPPQGSDAGPGRKPATFGDLQELVNLGRPSEDA